MRIEFSSEEIQLVVETLDATLSDLSVEIADTDRKSFRDGLKERRDLLNGTANRMKLSAS